MISAKQLTLGEKLRLAQNTFGLMARVAKKCAVTRHLVSSVLRGKSESKRVMATLDGELTKELRKAEKQLARAHARNKTNGKAAPLDDISEQANSEPPTEAVA